MIEQDLLILLEQTSGLFWGKPMPRGWWACMPRGWWASMPRGRGRVRWHGVACSKVNEVGWVGWCGMRWGQVDVVRNSCGMVWDRVGIEFFLPPYKAQVKSLCMKANGRASQSKRYIFRCPKTWNKERLKRTLTTKNGFKRTVETNVWPVQMSARRCGSRVRMVPDFGA